MLGVGCQAADQIAGISTPWRRASIVYPGSNIFVEEGRIGTVNLEVGIEDEIAVPDALRPPDFFQANPGTASLIVQDVLALSEDLADHPVDLYSGVGTFAALASGTPGRRNRTPL